MPTREQIEKNERLFREVNERIHEIGERLARSGGVEDEPVSFMCECASTECTDRLELTLRQYAEVRSDPTWFAVAPGHELPEFECVVTRHATYTVVAKPLLG